MINPFTIEVFLNGWKWEDDCITLDCAKEAADDFREAYSHCYRVVRTATGEELYRTDGDSEFTNR